MRGTVTLNICDDRIALTIILLEVHRSYLDEPLELVTDKYIARYGHVSV